MLGVAAVAAVALVLLMDRTRLGAMIRAGVDDRMMARGVGIPVGRLFTAVFFLGAALAGFAGVIGGPILSAYAGLDTDMLPLALIVVILGGIGSLPGALVGSFIVGFIYNFGTALFPDFAYVVLFLPMVLALVFRPAGLFGRPCCVTRRQRSLLTALSILLALALLPAVLPGTFYLSIASHVMVAAVLALSLNILIGYGGMTSLGPCRLSRRPAYAYAWLTGAGFGAGAATVSALAIGTALAAAVRRAGAAGIGPRVPDDHPGLGTNRCGASPIAGWR